MNILIIAATQLEIKPFITKINSEKSDNEFPERIHFKNHSINFLITGVGMVFTTYKLTKALNIKGYDLVINAGIAGSFNRNIKIGDVVFVEQEEFGDLGIENSNRFETVFEKGFTKKNEFPFKDGLLNCNFPESTKSIDLTHVKALTSNTAHGNQNTINKLIEKFNPDIETMEGAAFFYVCLIEKVNFIEIRAISNYVETRDTSKWDIPQALENLSNHLIKIINKIE
jgi:futalosine hydrolase